MIPAFDVTFYATITVAVLITLLLLKYNWNRRKLYAFSRKLDGDFALPIIGNAYSFLGGSDKLMAYLCSLLRKHPGPVRVWVGHLLLVFVRTPEDVRILFNNSNSLEKLEILKKNIPIDALFITAVEKWKKRRKMLQACFNQTFLDSFMEIYNKRSFECCEEQGKYIEDPNFDFESSVRRCYVNILCETQMGTIPKDELLDKKIRRILELVFRKMHNAFYFYDFIFNLTPMARESHKLHQGVYEIIRKMVEEKEEETRQKALRGEIDKSVVKPFFDKLLEISTVHPEFTREKITETIGEFLFAGTDTNVTITCAAILLIAMHPEVEKKLLDELHVIFGNSNRPVTIDDIRVATYTDWIMKETMRLFPISFLIGRETTGEVQFETMTVPSGASVVVCMSEYHRDPRYWQDPLTFNPERFSPEEVAKREPCAYIPFSLGARNCIGYLYALKTVKTVLINLVRGYKFRNIKYKTVEDIETMWKLTLKPIDYGVVVERRREEFF